MIHLDERKLRTSRFSCIFPSNEDPLGLQNLDAVWNHKQRTSGLHDEIGGITGSHVSARISVAWMV
jgi:hypothetical protein